VKAITPSTKSTLSRIKRLQAAILLTGLVVFGYAFTTLQASTTGAEPIPESPTVEANENEDYSKFRHSNPMHSRLPCLLCHVRSEGRTTPKMPGHMPCASCHVQQFADNQSQLCIICHTPTGVKAFPPLRSFNVRFDHSKHLRQTSCATCHKPSRRGVALSVPSGASAHVTCFQCHGPRTEVGGRNIGSCAVCHQPGTPVRGSDWAKAFSVNFSHQEHARKGAGSCSTCHTVQAGSARGRQVTAPTAAMHFARAGKPSCATCHNNRRAFGAEDFANCKRCHEGKTFKF